MISTKKVFIGSAVLFILLVGVFVFLVRQSIDEKKVIVQVEELQNIDIDVLTNEELFSLGQQYFNQGDDPAGDYDLEKARLFYTALIKRDPTANAQVWYQLGRIDFLEGRFDSAIYKFNKQIQYFDEEVPNVHYMLGLTYGYKAGKTEKTEDWQKGEEGFLRFLDFYPTSPWARTDLSWIYFAQGKYEEIKPVVEEGLVHTPDSPWLLNMYGLALLNTGNKKEAHEYFVRADFEAKELTLAEWGRAYPGNNPTSWGNGLEGMRTAIAFNLKLTEE